MPVDNTVIAKKYIDAVKNNTIEFESLIRVPELVTCNDWTRVEIVGGMDFISERTKAVYNGLLVKHAGGLYYVRRKLADALGAIDKRFKNVKTIIRVV